MMDSGFLTFTLPFLSRLPTASPLLHCTNFLFKARSFIPTLVFHWSKKLPLAAGDKHPIAEEDDRPKNFSCSKAGFNDCSPSVLHAASDLSQYWFSLSSRRLEITFSLTFPLRFPICQFLFHILILSFNTDIYSVSLKACMRYIPVFPYIEEHVESLPWFCCWAAEPWTCSMSLQQKLHYLYFLTCSPCCSLSTKFILSLLYSFSSYPVDTRVLGPTNTW